MKSHIVNQSCIGMDKQKCASCSIRKWELTRTFEFSASQNKVGYWKDPAHSRPINADDNTRITPRSYSICLLAKEAKEPTNNVKDKDRRTSKRHCVLSLTNYPRGRTQNYIIEQVTAASRFNFSNNDLWRYRFGNTRWCLLKNNTNYKIFDYYRIIFQEQEHNIPVLKAMFGTNERNE